MPVVKSLRVADLIRLQNNSLTGPLPAAWGSGFPLMDAMNLSENQVWYLSIFHSTIEETCIVLHTPFISHQKLNVDMLRSKLTRPRAHILRVYLHCPMVPRLTSSGSTSSCRPCRAEADHGHA